MQKTQNIQDTMLNQIRRDRQTVTFFLMNGFQMKGVVRSFDSFVVVLDTDGIWYALVFAEAAALLVSAALLVKNRNRYHYV